MRQQPTEPEVQQFRWRGIDQLGRKRRGRLIALSLDHAIQQLSRQQLVLTHINGRRLTSLERFDQRVTGKDIQLLITQLATMLSSGLAVAQAIELTLSQSKKAGVLLLLAQLKQQISNGASMAQAMASSHPLLQGIISELIAAGETSGQLAESFSRLAQYIEKQQQIRAKAKKAAIYPSVVLSVSLLLAYLMLTEIIPQFATMFASLGTDLPWFTQQVLNLSNFLQQSGIWLLGGLIILATGAKSLYRRNQAFRFFICQIKPWIPALGPISRKTTLARFCQTFAATYRCGIPIIEALDTAIRTTDDLLFQRSASQITTQLGNGIPLNQALHHSELFPNLVIQLVMVGEESGNLDQTLEHIAQLYEQEVDNSVENLEKLLEPLVIVVLGGIVGSLVIAMYLPIFNLMSVLG